MFFWSGIISITGSGVFSLISDVFASLRPSTFLANSITVQCIPKQMPRNGILFSLAYWTAIILPSTPLVPKPPGTMIPSMPANAFSTPVSSTSSEFTQRILTLAPLWIPAWWRLSTIERYASWSSTYLPTIAISTFLDNALSLFTTSIQSVKSGLPHGIPSFLQTTSAMFCSSSIRGTS